MQDTNTHGDTISLAISGMSCGHCVARVKKVLADVPGITGADVAIGSATITFDNGATDKVVAAATVALGAAGYPARVAGDVGATTGA
ncbi:MAG: cation transporter [Gemmatimonadota bacterium]|nr:cation transporter [Gemmatimonadota bacterium]